MKDEGGERTAEVEEDSMVGGNAPFYEPVARVDEGIVGGDGVEEEEEERRVEARSLTDELEGETFGVQVSKTLPFDSIVICPQRNARIW